MTVPSFSILPFWDLPLWGMLLSVAAHLGIGVALGVIYLRAVWWNTRRFVPRTPDAKAIALMTGRFLLLGGLLVLIGVEGPMPLLMTAVGVLIARSLIMRQVRTDRA